MNDQSMQAGQLQENDLPGIRLQKPQKNIDQGSLSCPVFPEKSVHAVFHGDGHALQYFLLPICFMNVLQFYLHKSSPNASPCGLFLPRLWSWFTEMTQSPPYTVYCPHMDAAAVLPCADPPDNRYAAHGNHRYLQPHILLWRPALSF